MYFAQANKIIKQNAKLNENDTEKRKTILHVKRKGNICLCVSEHVSLLLSPISLSLTPSFHLRPVALYLFLIISLSFSPSHPNSPNLSLSLHLTLPLFPSFYHFLYVLDSPLCLPSSSSLNLSKSYFTTCKIRKRRIYVIFLRKLIKWTKS